jgi:uncharacterized protein
MIELDSQILIQIVDRLTRVSRPDRIILFGSAAQGPMTTDSDIDVLVVASDIEDPRSESQRLRDALRGLGIAIDVVVMRSDRFEETKGVIGGIAYPANKYGRVIYEVA